MTKLMYDSVNPSAIPTDAPVVAGYADGRFQWSSVDWARFPHSIAVSIACFPASQADILDIETGCAAPADVPGWLDRYNRPVFKVPTLYVNRSNWDAVRTAVGFRQVDYWVATLDGTQMVPGAAAVQYTDTGAYDISLCQDYWPRVPPMTLDPNDPIVQDILARLANVQDQGNRNLGLLSRGFQQSATDGLPKYVTDQLIAIQTRLANLQVPPANLQPVLDAIAALKADLDALTLKKV